MKRIEEKMADIEGQKSQYNMKNRDWRRYKKPCTEDNDASVPFTVGTLGPHTGLPIAIRCPVVFS